MNKEDEDKELPDIFEIIEIDGEVEVSREGEYLIIQRSILN